jgi:hypothetical protein
VPTRKQLNNIAEPGERRCRNPVRNLIFAATLFLATTSSLAAPLMPTKQGTIWQYNVTEETGGENAAAQSQIHCRIGGTQQFGGKELLKLETFVGEVATKTELVTIDENGILSFAHTGKDGKMIGFVSPQIIVPAKLKEGASWDCVDEIADVRVHQHFTVANTEKVSVPAGEFGAFRLHCEESAPISVTIDRWFVAGVGFVKEIATLRSPTGNLLNRRTLELASLPTAEAEAEDAVKKLSVGVSSQPIGDFATEFPGTTQNLYARWQGHDLREHAKVRAVWIAEDVGEIAPPNYKIDDAVATAGAPDAHGMFTLSRPDDGWAPGNYRVEFYLDDTLIVSVKLKIK